jgi:hypothetical protein
MFILNWSDPETLWLNLTNVVLGLVVIILLGLVGCSVVVDLAARRKQPPQAGGMNSHNSNSGVR